MARPRTIFPNEATLWDLAYLGCSNREIAEAVGVEQNLLSRRPDLASVLDFARADRAAAIERLWEEHPAGALRSPDRASQLTALIADADRRSIQRQRPLRRRLSASSGESSERANVGSGIKNGK
jgi:hypothetical protein